MKKGPSGKTICNKKWGERKQSQISSGCNCAMTVAKKTLTAKQKDSKNRKRERERERERETPLAIMFGMVQEKPFFSFFSILFLVTLACK